MAFTSLRCLALQVVRAPSEKLGQVAELSSVFKARPSMHTQESPVAAFILNMVKKVPVLLDVVAVSLRGTRWVSATEPKIQRDLRPFARAVMQQQR
jgi:hypothetical protein